jgi:hypothetical protein
LWTWALAAIQAASRKTIVSARIGLTNSGPE